MGNTTSNRGRILGIGLCVIVLGAGGVWAGKHWRDRRADQELYAKLADGNESEAALWKADFAEEVAHAQLHIAKLNEGRLPQVRDYEGFNG